MGLVCGVNLCVDDVLSRRQVLGEGGVGLVVLHETIDKLTPLSILVSLLSDDHDA